jgi:demethylmenaquinone methyltransferase/2-methoxy-6-polyprenyl-1,4-benzoquinol methylase/phosphoethanolamine N-methyltransferase
VKAVEGQFPTNKPFPQTKGNTIRWARHYDKVVGWLTLGKDRALREATAEMAQIKPGDSVLEVGCGTGALTIAANVRAGSTGKVYGIDASPEMIQVARAKAARLGKEIDFRVDLIEALSFADHTFDVVLSSLMMHHLPDDLKRKGLSEIYRVLKPGGRLLVIDVKRPTSLHGLVALAFFLHTKIEHGVQDLPLMMKATGFTDIEVRDVGMLPMLGFVQGITQRMDA